MKKLKNPNYLINNRGGYRLIAAAILLIFIGIKMPLNAQITKQQAIDYVMDSIVGNQSDSVNVYMDSLVQTAAYYNLSPYDSIQSPYSNYWLFFIDEMPKYLWGHDCKYVFINQANGDDWEKQKQLPPFLYEDFMQEVSVPFSLTVPEPDFSVSGNQYSTENDNCNLYAVLFTSQLACWNSLSHMFCTLRERGYPEDNIFILSNDGTGTTNFSLDLDQDDDYEIFMECNSDNLEDVFNNLASIMDSDDMLFVFANTYFLKDDPAIQDEINLILWEQESLGDDTFADFVEPINCSRMIFSFEGSYSGGVVDNLEEMTNNARKTYITGSNWEKQKPTQSAFWEKTGMTQYNFFLISALRGYYPDHYKKAPWEQLDPIGSHRDFSFISLSGKPEKNYDLSTNGGNNDGIHQINEAFEFVSQYDYDTDNDIFHFYEYGTQTYNNAFASEDLLSLHGISGKVETTQTLSGSFLIGGPLSVEPGVVLTINASSFHVFDSKIIIKPGVEETINNEPVIVTESGKLIANSATFTNACDTPWKGIEVWGNINHHQFDLPGQKQAQGRLVLNEATIENADIAVSLYDGDDSDPSTGGIVIANGANFINNGRSIDFRSYSNNVEINNSEVEYDNVSYFQNCDFKINSNYLHDENNYTATQIKMRGVNGIKIKGCEFENLLDGTPNGRAIHAHNAGFIIDDGCSDNQQPCTVAESSFKGFEIAVETGNSSNSLYPIYIKNSDFTYNGTGITFYKVTNSVIVGNTFDLGYSDRCGNNKGKGIYLDNSGNFAIEDNTFKVTNSAGGTHYVGIHTNNTNNAGDEIYKNTFTDMNIANFAEGKNWNGYNWDGLAYYCNKNTGSNWDFYVKDYTSPYDGIQKFQGSDNMAAGNEFSSSASWHFDNNGAYWISYFYDNNTTPEIPDANKLYRVRPEALSLSSYCPNHYGNGNGIRLSSAEYTQKESDYSSALASYNLALISYEAANDSTLKEYYAKQLSYYNTLINRAAYDIIRSNMSDTIVQDSLFAVWQEKLNTYTSAESMIDYYIQKGSYTTAQNKVDSLQYNFTFTSYDSTEYPYYMELKELQIDWLDDGRDIFELTTTEVDKLETIADSSSGTAGAQARAILSFAFDTTYFYTNCVTVPDTSQKSSPIIDDNTNIDDSYWISASPNPASNYINFNYSIGDNTSTVLRLYNQNGVLMDEIILEKGSNTFRYNCSNYKVGIYYYSTIVEKEILTGKIVILN